MYTHIHHGSGVWGCHLCLGRLIKTNFWWSDSSLSQADPPGGQFRHPYSGYWSLVLLLLSLRTVVSKWGWREQPLVSGWLVLCPPPSICFWQDHHFPTFSPCCQCGLRSQSWPITSPCFTGHSNLVSHGPLSLSRLKSHSNCAVTFQNEVLLVSTGLEPNRMEI